ncbi:tetratricopeptide repeat protein [Candidatus Sumerlaeota bacterium]|nr:tetratricopeptide repeat protein [Candidatus Sumerlaeota bacterium]
MRLIPLAFAVAALLGGCSLFGRETIPDFPTAREQYQFADSIYSRTRPLPVENPHEHWRVTDVESPYFEPPLTRYRQRDYQQFIEAFERVVNRFPDDTEFTPIAMVRLGEFHHLAGDPFMAASRYNQVLDICGDDEVLSAAALYGLARVQMSQQQFTEAQHCYQLLIERHRDSQNPRIIDLVGRAAQHLAQIQYQFSR